MLFLYRFFCGVLDIEFSGIYPEKILNLCAKNKISIWSAKFKNGKICCKITVRDFLKLPNILKNSGIRTHIKKKNGFPFFFKKYEKRFGVFSGLLIFFAFLYIMSGYVWVIDVVGNTRTETKDILKVCEEIGIKPGTKIKSISQKNAAQQMLLKLDTLAWGSINIEGCYLTVNVTEIKEKEDNSTPSNLLACADGIITHIDLKSGNCLVKVGDIVKKGDLLVSGIIEREDETRFVRSTGTITAKTETLITLEEPLKYTASYPTGKTKKKSVMEFFGINIPLYLGGESGEYETEKTEKQLKLFGKNIPIKIHSKRFIFKKNITVTQTVEQAQKKLEKRLEKEYNGSFKNKKFLIDNNKVYLEAVLIEEKNIEISENLRLGIGKQ